MKEIKLSVSKGVLGCLMSHLMLLQEIINNKDIEDNDYVGIYEDDIFYCDNFDKKYNEFKKINLSDYNVDFTNKESKLTGASDLLLNADISFLTEWNNKQSNLSSTIAFTQFSDRVYSIGTNGRGNQIDKAFGSLDFITKAKLNKNLGLGLVVKNILDPSIERIQENANGDVNVLSYKKGLTMSLGINYQF